MRHGYLLLNNDVSGSESNMLISQKSVENLGRPYCQDWLWAVGLFAIATSWLIGLIFDAAAIMRGEPLIFVGEIISWSNKPKLLFLLVCTRTPLILLGSLFLMYFWIVVQRWLHFRAK